MAKGNCEFKGSGGQYFGTVFIHLYLLGTITFGIYSAWAWVRILKLKASHTLMNGKEVSFQGTGGQLFGLLVVQGLLTLVTFGIYGPWAFCKYFDWRAGNTMVGGKPSQFNGTGGTLFLFYLIHLLLLPLITLGLYYFWGFYRFYAWKEEHTRYGGEETSFGGPFGTFLKISIVTWILNTFTLNLFAPWAYCMFSRWQIDGLAVGDGATVEHFPPVKTNVLVVTILIVAGIFCLLAIGFVVKNAAERGWKQQQQFVRLKKLHTQTLRKRESRVRKPHFLKPKFKAAVKGERSEKHLLLKSDVREKLRVDMAMYGDAVKKTEARMKEKPEDANAHYDRAWLYGAHMELEKAVEEYTQAIRLNKKFADAYYNRGLIYSAKGRYKEGIRDFNAAIELGSMTADVYCNRGNGYFFLGKTKQALADFNRALKVSPSDADALYDRALVYETMGDRAKAKEDLRRAMAFGQPLALSKLNELEGGSSATGGPGWKMDLKGVSIPAGPASGMIHGDPVTIDKAILEHGILTLRDGKDSFPDHAFMIFLFLKKEESFENGIFEYSTESGFGSPHIHMKWKEAGKDLPETKVWMRGYPMVLQFGKRNGNEVPGKIYLCIPDQMKSFIAGSFTARVKS
jgi:uncharacterized membrane protein YjgN (DUF898 family)